MSTSQSSSSSQDENERRKVYCSFLEQTHDENGNEKCNINDRIFFAFFIPNDQEYSTSSIKRDALSAIQKIYPGVEMIDLYLSKEDFDKLGIKTDSSQSYLCIHKPAFRLSHEQLDALCKATFYFNITSIYGEEDFNTIKRVKCNYTTPAGDEDTIALLLPKSSESSESSIKKIKFKDAFSHYFNADVELNFFDKKSKELNTSIKDITEQTFKDNTVVFNLTSCSQIIKKIISSDNEHFVYQLSSFLYKEDIADIKPFSSDVFKNGVEIYNFSNNKFIVVTHQRIMKMLLMS